MKRLIFLVVAAGIALSTSAHAEDAEGCKDYPLFSRLPGYSISTCETTEYEERNFNVGPAIEDPEMGSITRTVAVQGRFMTIQYYLDEGATRKSPLQIMRNFQNAVKAVGGTVEGEWPGWCEVSLDEVMFLGNNNCANFSTTLKMVKGGHEIWTLVHPGGEGEEFTLFIMEREAMKQDISVTEMLNELNSAGFVTLYINFETGKATIQAGSQSMLDSVAEMLEAAPSLSIEVAGHTDNIGTAEANQKLSDARARSVMAALTQRGIAANRMVAKGYGQSSPIADNRTEEGRAKNRRVELVKR